MCRLRLIMCRVRDLMSIRKSFHAKILLNKVARIQADSQKFMKFIIEWKRI